VHKKAKGGLNYARQAFDNWCCRRDHCDPHSAVRPNGRLLTPASTSGAPLTPALLFAAPSFGVSLARISELNARRVWKFTEIVSIVRPPQSRADDGAGARQCLDDQREAAGEVVARSSRECRRMSGRAAGSESGARINAYRKCGCEQARAAQSFTSQSLLFC
jgi:hypothetical protein